jgi:lipopolysaccharide transport protein LptA
MNPKIKVCLSILLISLVNFASAKDNSVTTLTIDAKNHYSRDRGYEAIFLGSVKAQQEHAQLLANKLIIHSYQENQQKQIDKLIAIGHPAQYKIHLKQANQTLIASANKIIYYNQRHFMLLTGQAKLQIGDKSFSSPYIAYNQAQQLITSHPYDSQATQKFMFPNALVYFNYPTPQPSQKKNETTG